MGWGYPQLQGFSQEEARIQEDVVEDRERERG